jgi:hypothetical protein
MHCFKCMYGDTSVKMRSWQAESVFDSNKCDIDALIVV